MTDIEADNVTQWMRCIAQEDFGPRIVKRRYECLSVKHGEELPATAGSTCVAWGTEGATSEGGSDIDHKERANGCSQTVYVIRCVLVWDVKGCSESRMRWPWRELLSNFRISSTSSV